MTVLGIVSDTHLPRFGRALPRSLVAGLEAAKVERILHCGDMTDLLAAELFAAIAPFDAVAGNNDGAEIRERFGRKKVLAIEGVRIGFVHGDGKHAAQQNALNAFAGESLDVICFGHSHRPGAGETRVDPPRQSRFAHRQADEPVVFLCDAAGRRKAGRGEAALFP